MVIVSRKVVPLVHVVERGAAHFADAVPSVYTLNVFVRTLVLQAFALASRGFNTQRDRGLDTSLYSVPGAANQLELF